MTAQNQVISLWAVVIREIVWKSDRHIRQLCILSGQTDRQRGLKSEKSRQSNKAGAKIKHVCKREESLMNIEELSKELEITNKHIHKLRTRQTRMAEYSAGTVIAKPFRDHYQYYFKRLNEKKEYIPMAEVSKYKPYAQYDYEKKTLKDLLERRKILEKFLEKYNPEGTNATYNKLCEGKKRLVIPIEPTDEMRIEAWMQEHPGNRHPMIIESDLLTDRGELMRSKSEKIIADQLIKNHIPYQYEPRLQLSDHYIYPDFAVYNVKERRTVYWEHFGLLSNEDYAAKNYERIQEYERSGLILGKDLIITMESPGMPLDVKLIQKKIDLFL